MAGLVPGTALPGSSSSTPIGMGDRWMFWMCVPPEACILQAPGHVLALPRAWHTLPGVVVGSPACD